MKKIFYINFIFSTLLLLLFYFLQNEIGLYILYILIVMCITGMFLVLKMKMHCIYILFFIAIIILAIFNIFLFKSIVVR